MPAEHKNQFEQDFHERLVDQTAKRAQRMPQNSSEQLVNLIDQVAVSEGLQKTEAERFRRDVMKKVSAWQKTYHSEKEAKIFKQFDGAVEVANQKFFPAGLSKDFSVSLDENSREGKAALATGVVGGAMLVAGGAPLLAAGGFLVAAEIVRRLSKKKIDGEKIYDKITKVNNRREGVANGESALAKMKAEEVGLWECFKLARQVGRHRDKSVGVLNLGFFDGLDAAAELRDQQSVSQKQERKKLEKNKKKLVKEEAELKIALEKIEDLRKDGRELFEKTFNRSKKDKKDPSKVYLGEVDLLLKERDQLDEYTYNQRVDGLRKKVRGYGDSIGIVRMDYFLNEKLGIKPPIVERIGQQDYAEPVGAKEQARERMEVSRWWERVLDPKPTDQGVNGLITTLRKENPLLLRQIATRKVDEQKEALMTFLFTGKNGTSEQLATDRLMTLNPKNILDVAMYKVQLSDPAAREIVFKQFAAKWQDYKADDFEYVYDMIVKGITPPIPAYTAPVAANTNAVAAAATTVAANTNAAPPATPDQLKKDRQLALMVAFNLPVADLAILDTLDQDVLEQNPQLVDQLKKPVNQKMLRFFMSGDFTHQLTSQPDLEFHTKISHPQIKLLDSQNVDDLKLALDILPILHDMGPVYFTKEAEQFFASGPADVEMKKFISHIKVNS